jgi:hypothetical protein
MNRAEGQRDCHHSASWCRSGSAPHDAPGRCTEEVPSGYKVVGGRAVIPLSFRQRSLRTTGRDWLDSAHDVTCNDGIGQHVVDDREATHNRSQVRGLPAPRNAAAHRPADACFACWLSRLLLVASVALSTLLQVAVAPPTLVGFLTVGATPVWLLGSFAVLPAIPGRHQRDLVAVDAEASANPNLLGAGQAPRPQRRRRAGNQRPNGDCGRAQPELRPGAGRRLPDPTADRHPRQRPPGFWIGHGDGGPWPVT